MTEVGKAKHRSKKPAGLPPGSMYYIGPERQLEPRITVMEYNGDFLNEREITSLDELGPLDDPYVTTWINVDAVHDSELLSAFGERFNLHPLMLEDILNTEHRPKCEAAEGKVYLFAKMLEYVPKTRTIMTEQVSIVLGSNWLITFQEEIGDEFEANRQRLRNGSRQIRTGGADYLAYTLIDTVVDRYFTLLESFGEELENLEDRLEKSDKLTSVFLQDIHVLKKELIFMRKSVWPMRELVNTMMHLDCPEIREPVQAYLRDVYDHTIQIMDTLDTYRDLLSSTQDLFLSILSNRMNEIMKVLTIISTIFIPLTFIVGVYGMNFEFMPELHWRTGYPFVWGVMILVTLGELAYFKHKGWLLTGKDPGSHATRDS